MQESILIIAEPMLVLAVGAIFVLLFATILKVLKETSFCKGATAAIMALCVSLLSVIGLWQFLLPSGEGHALAEKGKRFGIGLDFILLLYAALAIAILSMLLLLFLNKLFRKRSKEKYYQESYRGKERRQPFASERKPVEKSDEEDRIRK